MADDLERRVGILENKLDNGRYLRRETFDLVTLELRGDIADLKSVIAKDKADRVSDRKSLRNLVLAAFAAGIVSIAVSLITVALVGQP